MSHITRGRRDDDDDLNEYLRYQAMEDSKIKDKDVSRKNKLYDLIIKNIHISDTDKYRCSENSYSPGNHRPACKFLDKSFLYCDFFDEAVPDHKRCPTCIEIFGDGNET